MRSILLFASVLILFSSILLGQTLTGNLKQDSRVAFQETESSVPPMTLTLPAKKSPMLAGLFSLILPGAGEFYSGEYLKGSIFLVVEAAVITTAIIYDNKGDKKTDEFQEYADERWSVVNYARWLNENKNASIEINEDPSLKPWERVNWDQLNAVEQSTSGFSHKLPQHGEQQYYEMIGKYFQYAAGWDDYTGGANNYLISPHYSFYADMRGQANDYYNVASKAVIGIYINHFLSVLDAVWSAATYNSNLSMNIRTENVKYAGVVEIVPVINLKYSF